MSSRLYTPAFADPHFGIARPNPTVGYTLAEGPGSPTSLSLPAAGYAKGCLFLDLTNGRAYINQGTTTAASWVQVNTGGGLTTPAVNTAISTAGAGTLTAAAITGQVITRTGPSAAYTDTTDTAAAIIAALPGVTSVLASWYLTVRNTTAFAQTLAAGAGVTLSGNTIIPPNSVGTFLVVYATATTVTILGMEIAPLTTTPLLVSTALTTAGAGSITAAGIAGGVTNRTGSTAAFTDTTPTAAAIIAAVPNANVGQSFWWTYYNNTLGVATLSPGDGNVTITGTQIPFNCWAAYLVTVATATTVTIVQLETGPNVALPAAQYVTQAYQSTTFAAGDLTGANVVHFNNTGTTPGNLQVRTAAQMFSDIPNCQIGFTYTLYIRNSSGSANTATITADGGATVTLTGTMTIPQNVTRMFEVRFPSASTCTIQSMGIFAAGA